MANQLEFLMQLYMMNLIQQQQQQLIQQQTLQQQNKDMTTTDLASLMLKKPPSHQEQQQQQQQHQSPNNNNCSSSASSCSINSSISSNIINTTCDNDFLHTHNNSSALQQQQLIYHNDNSINNPVNFSKSFLQSSTVTSTPQEKVTRTSNEIYDNVRVTVSDKQCAQTMTITDADVEEEEEPLFSTGTSGFTSSGEDSKILEPVLESTDSFSSPLMPITPMKHGNLLSSSTSTSGQDFSEDNNMKSLNVFVDSEDSSVSHKMSKMSSADAGVSEENSESKVTVKSESNFVSFDSINGSNGGSGVDSILQNEESLKYLKKFPSYLECESIPCRQENIREHFHCYDQPCCGKVLTKRDEIIRHLKWHKKRKESLAYGFLRFSSSDDCSQSFKPGCIYNWKQTHYHCVEESCPKVYVSTSDVQMHANYHRKNSEIIQEGFKRFRAIEDCKTESCPFYEKKTSHYHCRRDNCQFTFKNKADMEKHKSYHLRDERLTQDGFKKILKTETCPFENCRFSTVCNHIHCVRENCSYILHSSSQLVSHKRKHDRLDGEQAYSNFKRAQKDSSEDDSPKSSTQADVSTPLSSLTAESNNFQFLARKRGRPPKKISFDSINGSNGGSGVDSILQNEESLKYLKKFPSYLECESIPCRQENIREHFHCYDQPCCGKVLTKRDEIIRHLKWHKKRKESLAYGFLRFSSSDDCSQSFKPGCIYNWKQTHYHCVEESCPKVYVSTSDVQMHANYHRKNSEIIQEGFKRFRAIEDCKTESCPFYEKKTSHYHCRRDNCQFTFKNKADMEKHKSYHLRDERLTQDGFKKILKTETCPFENCRFSTVCNHIHCVRENCSYILHSSSQLVSHKRKHDRLDGEQAYSNFKRAQKDSSEDDSPKSSTQADVSTPLSSLTAESNNFQFLARKRGRPPKKIQLSNEAKKLKMETLEQTTTACIPPIGLPFPPFLPQMNSNSQDGISTPNFQLTHLMAMFQLQNPLFYQNLYPEGLFGLGGAAGLLGLPAQNSIFPTPASTPASTSTFVKSEKKQND